MYKKLKAIRLSRFRMEEKIYKFDGILQFLLCLLSDVSVIWCVRHLISVDLLYSHLSKRFFCFHFLSLMPPLVTFYCYSIFLKVESEQLLVGFCEHLENEIPEETVEEKEGEGVHRAQGRRLDQGPARAVVSRSPSPFLSGTLGSGNWFVCLFVSNSDALDPAGTLGTLPRRRGFSRRGWRLWTWFWSCATPGSRSRRSTRTWVSGPRCCAAR